MPRKAWSSDFAQKQLEKHGWTEGAGLGRQEAGIKEAIKVQIKNDKTGVGHDPGAEFTYHWWDHVFNKAAKSITIENHEDGVKVSKESKTSKKSALEEKKKLLYGNFIKAATLTHEGNEVAEPKDDSDDDSEAGDAENSASLSKFSDKELMKQCDGRTAHKAARHGLGLSAKLRRIEEHEKLGHPSGDNSGKTVKENGEVVKKKKKSKREKNECDGDSDSQNHEDKQENNVTSNDNSTGDKSSRKKKKSKKEKKKVTELHDNDVNSSGVLDEEHCSDESNGENVVKKKSKKSKNKTGKSNADGPEIVCDGQIDIVSSDSDRKTKKKKKKRKMVEALDGKNSPVSVDESMPSKKKKKKKAKGE